MLSSWLQECTDSSKATVHEHPPPIEPFVIVYTRRLQLCPVRDLPQMLTIGRNVLSDPSKIIQSARFVQEEVRRHHNRHSSAWPRPHAACITGLCSSSRGSMQQQHNSRALQKDWTWNMPGQTGTMVTWAACAVEAPWATQYLPGSQTLLMNALHELTALLPPRLPCHACAVAEAPCSATPGLAAAAVSTVAHASK
jgi:hypothetical protein